MKIKNIAILCLTLAAALATSCSKHEMWTPKARNVGEEVMSVKKDTTTLTSGDTLIMVPRGGTINLVICSSRDGEVNSSDWITLTSGEFPGDSTDYILSVNAEAFSDTLATGPREGFVEFKTPNLSCKLVVTQGQYIRPKSPETIYDAETFLFWLGSCADTFESDEVMTLSADIDLSDVKEFTPSSKFIATLDGQGHKLSGWKDINSPLFVINEGTIKNLTIASNCNFTVPGATGRFGAFAGTNRGVISGCENDAAITLSAERSIKNYVGGIAGYLEAEGTISGCTNKGSFSYTSPASPENVYYGGMTGYSYGKITLCHNYGPISCTPEAFTKQYFIGGISPRHQTGDLTYNINHKEAKIYINEAAGTSKSYIGGIVGYLAGAPATAGNENYADIEVLMKYETYIGGLQAWQDKVTGSAEFNMFEGSIVNCNITAYTAGTGKNSSNPCMSAGLVTGRFSGQKGSGTTLHYGNETNPIKVSGSMTCTSTGNSVVAGKKDFQDYLVGDWSASSVNNGNVPEADYNTIQYEVRGDGQTGDPESLDIKLDDYRLEVPMVGGTVSFGVKVNYDATVSVAAADASWLSVDTEKIPGDGEVYEIAVTAEENNHTYIREGKIIIKMEMGTTQEIVIAQNGNTTLPESLVVTPESIEADPAGTETSTFDVTPNYDATITASDAWIKLGAETVVGDEAKHSVKVSFEKNQSGAARQGTITVTLPKGLSKTISVNQEKFVYVPKAEISNAADFLDFMIYGNDAELYPATFEVKLTADIDLKGKTVGMINKFVGNINGQGHSLKNITSDRPLFGQNAGIIKNIVLDATCKFNLDPTVAPTSGSAIWTGALCGNVIQSGDKVDGVAVTSTGSVTGCVNKASVTMTAVPTMQTFIGGIAGRSSANVTISDCTNEGSVIIKPASTVGAEIRVAGIVAGSNGSISNCINNAPVEYSPADLSGKGFYLGGVVAYLAGNPMTSCVNKQKGTVTFNPSAYSGSTQSYVGGLLGYVDKITTVTLSKNFGDVKVTADKETIAVGGLTGWIKSGGAGFVLFDGCAVNCNVTAVTPATAVTTSTNPLISAGLVIGRVAMKNGADNVTCQIGTAESPCKVAGSVTVNGGSTATADADNYTNYLFGNSMTSNFFNSGAYKMNAENTKYEAVTKE